MIEQSVADKVAPVPRPVTPDSPSEESQLSGEATVEKQSVEIHEDNLIVSQEEETTEDEVISEVSEIPDTEE